MVKIREWGTVGVNEKLEGAMQLPLESITKRRESRHLLLYGRNAP